MHGKLQLVDIQVGLKKTRFQQLMLLLENVEENICKSIVTDTALGFISSL